MIYKTKVSRPEAVGNAKDAKARPDPADEIQMYIDKIKALLKGHDEKTEKENR